MIPAVLALTVYQRQLGSVSAAMLHILGGSDPVEHSVRTKAPLGSQNIKLKTCRSCGQVSGVKTSGSSARYAHVSWLTQVSCEPRFGPIRDSEPDPNRGSALTPDGSCNYGCGEWLDRPGYLFLRLGHRQTHTFIRFKLGCHRLAIVTGRWHGVARADRLRLCCDSRGCIGR